MPPTYKLREALAAFYRQKREAPIREEDEEDDFIVQPKEVLPVVPGAEPYSNYVYENEEVPVTEDEDQEEILSDLSDLEESGTESEPESEPDYSSIPRKELPYCPYIDNEAEESSGGEADDEQESNEEMRVTESEESDSDDDEHDRTITAPLRIKDFKDDEAVEHNDLNEAYGGITGPFPLSDMEKLQDSEATIEETSRDSLATTSSASSSGVKRRLEDESGDSNDSTRKKKCRFLVEPEVVMKREKKPKKTVRFMLESDYDEELHGQPRKLPKKKAKHIVDLDEETDSEPETEIEPLDPSEPWAAIKSESHRLRMKRRFEKIRRRIRPWRVRQVSPPPDFTPTIKVPKIFVSQH